jgi:hypothetical protein
MVLRPACTTISHDRPGDTTPPPAEVNQPGFRRECACLSHQDASGEGELDTVEGEQQRPEDRGSLAEYGGAQLDGRAERAERVPP